MSNQRNFASFVSSLVSDYAKYDGDTYNLHIDDLPDDEQGELAALYLETLDRDVSECVWGNDFTTNSDYVCSLLKMLKDPSPENRDDFSRLVHKNVLIYFRDSLQSAIEEACNEHLHEEMNENGYYGSIDRNHGDFVWRRAV